jgi:hypothetical protein
LKTSQLNLKARLLPSALAASLACLALAGAVRRSPNALASFAAAAALLVIWNLALLLAAGRKGRGFKLEIVLRKQHYVQACSQIAVFLYWGWYWREVYAYAPFLLAQLLFAYAFDLLLCWSRRDRYTLGFGPFPVIFSINLFLWFRPEWFFLQFAMIALGFTAKELIRWERDGRRVHIFNPSSFPLAVGSLALLATGSSGITWGQDIATTQFYPPQIYLVLFLVGLPGQFFFGVTTMTMSAVLSAYAFGRIYFAVTGIYYFYDSYIPIAVFLGMHLLFTDPSTSPRTELGRIFFGVFYGLSTIALYALLGRAGMPTFYDKLLQVPVMNLCVKGIDAAARFFRVLDPAALGRPLAPYQRNLAYMSVWAVVFAGLSATQGVGDRHPGQYLPFWRRACQEGRPYACPYLADLDLTYCNQGSGWSCNEAGLMDIALARSGEDLRRRDPSLAAEPLSRGCSLGFAPACANLKELASGSGRFSAPPPALGDFPVILRGSKGELRERDPAALYALACRQGWPGACGAH